MLASNDWSRRGSRRSDRFAVAVGAVLVLDLVFGGATQPDAVTTAVTRLASLPLLGFVLWRLRWASLGPGARVALGLLAAIVAVPLIQSIPLPPQMWERLPGRSQIALDYAAARLPAPWLPLSLAPYETRDVLIWLAPPAAMFLAALHLSAARRAWVAAVIPAVALVAVLLGVLQVLGGPDSRLRFYADTNPDSAVGFFANRNHQAALLICGAAFTPVWTAIIGERSRARVVAGLALAMALAVVLAVGIGVTRSRAGVFIGLAVLVAAGALTLRTGGSRAARTAGAGLVVAALLGAGLVGVFARTALIERFQAPIAAELRVQTVPALKATAASVFPVGGGLGSFDALYRIHEPLTSVTGAYLNHAHNDGLELLIETGAAGMIVLAAFGAWWLWRTIAAVRQRGSRDLPAVLSSLAIAALATHSLVDYPLRTTGLACIFALACGLLAGSSGAGRGIAIKPPTV